MVHAFMAIEGSSSNPDEDTIFLPPVLQLMNDRYPLYQNALLPDGCCSESLRLTFRFRGLRKDGSTLREIKSVHIMGTIC